MFGTKPRFYPVVVGSSPHVFRRVFGLNTGLQCRFFRYLYLVAFILARLRTRRPFFIGVFFGSSSELWITLFHTLTFKGYSPGRSGFSGEIDLRNSIRGNDTCTRGPEPGSGPAGGRFFLHWPDVPRGRVREGGPGFPVLRENPQIPVRFKKYPQLLERTHYPTLSPGPGRAGKMASAGSTLRQDQRVQSGAFPRTHPGGSRARSRTLPHGFR